MSMARASSSTKFAAPEYHWEGFGRKSTKPPWYNVSEHDGTRRPLEQWEGGTCGHPRVIEKILTKFPPFVHTTDERSYVPTLPQSKRVLDVTVEAPAHERQILSRGHDGIEHGAPDKYDTHAEETWRGRMQMHQNLRQSLKSELKEQIYGGRKPIPNPILYPQNLSHQMALSLENRAGPCQPFDQVPPTPDDEKVGNYKRVSQEMPLPYSRQRSEFAHCLAKDSLRGLPTTGAIPAHHAAAATAPPPNLNRTTLAPHKSHGRPLDASGYGGDLSKASSMARTMADGSCLMVRSASSGGGGFGSARATPLPSARLRTSPATSARPPMTAMEKNTRIAELQSTIQTMRASRSTPQL